MLKYPFNINNLNQVKRLALAISEHSALSLQESIVAVSNALGFDDIDALNEAFPYSYEKPTLQGLPPGFPKAFERFDTQIYDGAIPSFCTFELGESPLYQLYFRWEGALVYMQHYKIEEFNEQFPSMCLLLPHDSICTGDEIGTCIFIRDGFDVYVIDLWEVARDFLKSLQSYARQLAIAFGLEHYRLIQQTPSNAHADKLSHRDYASIAFNELVAADIIRSATHADILSIQDTQELPDFLQAAVADIEYHNEYKLHFFQERNSVSIIKSGEMTIGNFDACFYPYRLRTDQPKAPSDAEDCTKVAICADTKLHFHRVESREDKTEFGARLLFEMDELPFEMCIQTGSFPTIHT
ncbi:MAG: hypothetical protein GJ680_18610 [Alteromonadaceae bacterium]|nr:hypothetical protein [Alteromonadaceae bacterium]